MRAPLPRLRRRARVLADYVDGPADAWLATRMVGWRLVLPLLKWVLPLPRLARLMWSGSADSGELGAGRSERIGGLAHALSGPRGAPVLDNCLERSLLAYRYLSAAGARPELVIGVSRESEPRRGHAWVRLGGEPLRETEASLEEFEEVACFGPEGALSGSRAPSGAHATTRPLPGQWR
jgi:Transglutaminase-like superfamily